MEKTPESPLDSKEIKPVNPEGNQRSIFTGRTDAEAEAPILGQPDVMNRLIRKDPDAGKDLKAGEGWAAEGKMVGCHDRLNGHAFGQTLGDLQDREAWRAAIHGVTESWTQLSD